MNLKQLVKHEKKKKIFYKNFLFYILADALDASLTLNWRPNVSKIYSYLH